MPRFGERETLVFCMCWILENSTPRVAKHERFVKPKKGETPGIVGTMSIRGQEKSHERVTTLLLYHKQFRKSSKIHALHDIFADLNNRDHK